MTLSSSLRGPAILALSLWSLSAHAHLVTFELEGKLECFASCDIFGQQTGLDTSPPNQLYGFTSLVTVDDQSVPSFSNSSRSQYMFDGDGLFTVTMGVLTLSWDRFSMTIAQYQPSGEDGLFVVDSGDTIVGIGWRETYLIAPTIAGIAEAPLELFHKAITEMIVRPPGRGTFELQGHSSDHHRSRPTSPRAPRWSVDNR